jgi:ADP-heptose:LPS heptosyltransferase
MGPRVLIIKLGALGDVVRTACLVPGLKQLTGEQPHISWLTDPGAVDLVARIPQVDRVIPFTHEAVLPLQTEQFSIVISLDKEAEPCSVAMQVRTESRLGIGLSRYGTPYPLNDECDYYFRLGLDNDEKFLNNRKSMQQLLYEALGLRYQGESYRIQPTDEDLDAAEMLLQAAGMPKDGVLVGINPGAGNVYAHKAWREDGYVELISRLAGKREDLYFVMLGGPAEEKLMRKIADEACRSGLPGGRIHIPGPALPLGVSAAVIARCHVLVTADTLSMHLAIAQQRHVVAVFGPTCEQEIDLFGRGEKVVSPIECSPCYLRVCDKSPHCQDMVSTDSVLEAVVRQLDAVASAEIVS